MVMIKYLWTNEILHTVELLEAYAKNIEEHIDISFKNYKENKKTFFIDHNGEYPGIIDEYLGIDSITWDLENLFSIGFPNMQRCGALITIMSSLEVELNKVCEYLKAKCKKSVTYKDLKGTGVTRAIQYLKKVIELDIDISDEKWKKITQIQKIRNTIVHHDSVVEARNDPVMEYIANSNTISYSYRIILNKGSLQEVLEHLSTFISSIIPLITKFEK